MDSSEAGNDGVQTVDGVRMEKRVGMGTFGDVFLHTAADGQPVAIKVFDRDYMATIGASCMLSREISVAQALQTCSPYCVPILAVDTYESTTHMRMPYLAGGSIEDAVRRHPEGLDTAAAASYAAQVACALVHIHRAGYVYGDLNPGNLMLDSSGRVTLVDFGLSFESHPPASRTCGVPPFMAPEVMRREHHTAAADWWSLGVLIIYMMTGSIPFEGDDPVAVLRAINHLVSHSSQPSSSQSNDATLLDALIIASQPELADPPALAHTKPSYNATPTTRHRATGVRIPRVAHSALACLLAMSPADRLRSCEPPAHFPKAYAGASEASNHSDMEGPGCLFHSELFLHVPWDQVWDRSFRTCARSGIPPRHVNLADGEGQKLGSISVVCVSDTHSLTHLIPPESIPPGDVLLHCGDFTQKGKAKEIAEFDAWLAHLPHQTKLVISGNHETGPFVDFNPASAGDALPHARYCNNDVVDVGGVRFMGVPWKQQFKTGKRIPEGGVDVLFAHEPPAGILDGGHGCDTLLHLAQAHARVSVFGHIHEAAGVETAGNATFINCAVANNGMRSHSVVRPFVKFDIAPRGKDP